MSKSLIETARAHLDGQHADCHPAVCESATQPTDLDGKLDQLFGRQEELDAINRSLPKRARSLAETREHDEAVFFGDRDASGGVA